MLRQAVLFYSQATKIPRISQDPLHHAGSLQGSGRLASQLCRSPPIYLPPTNVQECIIATPNLAALPRFLNPSLQIWFLVLILDIVSIISHSILDLDRLFLSQSSILVIVRAVNQVERCREMYLLSVLIVVVAVIVVISGRWESSDFGWL